MKREDELLECQIYLAREGLSEKDCVNINQFERVGRKENVEVASKDETICTNIHEQKAVDPLCGLKRG